MAKLPLRWREYATHQSALQDRTSVDPAAWGLEEGLQNMLDAASSPSPTDTSRIVANAARRSRYACALLAKYVIVQPATNEALSQLEARSSLATLSRNMPRDALSLLLEVASGQELENIALKRSVSTGALRTRVARARAVARKFAA